jgi:ubiquinone/menaquinone biosynthesis C-methylase UbiE
MNLTKQYNGFAKDYSRIIKDKSRHSRRIFYKHLNFPLVGRKILDAGCGDGTDLLYFTKHKAKVFGIDSSEAMIDLAGQNAPLAKTIVGDFSRLPFSNHFFDVVISKHALQSSANLQPILKEFYRVLKPKGFLLYLSVHPLRQFMEKKMKKKDYFLKEKVESILFGGLLKVTEPTHTFNEYLSAWVLKNFDICEFEECYDPYSAEKVDGSSYPGFFIIKAQKRR